MPRDDIAGWVGATLILLCGLITLAAFRLAARFDRKAALAQAVEAERAHPADDLMAVADAVTAPSEAEQIAMYDQHFPGVPYDADAVRICSTCDGDGAVYCAAHIAGDGCDDMHHPCPDCVAITPAPTRLGPPLGTCGWRWHDDICAGMTTGDMRHRCVAPIDHVVDGAVRHQCGGCDYWIDDWRPPASIDPAPTLHEKAVLALVLALVLVGTATCTRSAATPAPTPSGGRDCRPVLLGVSWGGVA